MEPVTLAFQYTEASYVRGVREYTRYAKIIRRFDPLIALLLAALSIVYWVLSGQNVWSIVMMVVAGFALLLGLYVYFAAPKRAFREQKYQEPYTLVFSEEGIHFTTPTIDSRLAWATYRGIWSSDAYYFLIQNRHVYTLLPKSAFSSEEQRKRFEALATKHIGPIAQKR